MLKKILLGALLILSLSGCKDDRIDIGSISLGQKESEVISSIGEHLESEWSNTKRFDGSDISLLGITWDKINCIFEQGRLVRVGMYKQYSTIPKYEIELVKSKMEELCGDGYSKDIIACYGTDKDNNGCLGGIMVEWRDDVFFAVIYLPGYDPND